MQSRHHFAHNAPPIVYHQAMPPGVKRSRVLWDEARKEDASWTATARAILYELQPIRFSTIDVSGIVSTASRLGRFLVALACSIVRSVPGVVRGLIRILRGMSRSQWGVVGIVVAYYYFVRLIHQYLEAGPLVVIATGMIGIFTIGLGDGDSAGMSAYSVFNRGFQQLLGSVDVEALVQQYAGGGLAVQAQMNANRDQGMDEHNGARAGRQRGDIRAAAQPQPPPAAAGANENEEADNDNDDTPQDGRNRARRSNKKSRNKDRRERNTTVRREMELQRQAAAAMGFVGEGEQDDAAIHRLIEEQVLGEQHQHEED